MPVLLTDVAIALYPPLLISPFSYSRCTYDELIEIDLSTLEPHLNGPFSPDVATPLSTFSKAASENGYAGISILLYLFDGPAFFKSSNVAATSSTSLTPPPPPPFFFFQSWPKKLSAALIGSCTNSSYEDMTRAASIARQALERGLAAKVPFFVTPGSDQIYQTCKRDGILDVFEKAGGTVLANACGPCIGQWDRRDVPQSEPNSILTSFNRNFAGRNDGNKYTHNFLCSPEVVTAMAFSGDLSFNPMTDALEGVGRFNLYSS